MKINVIDKDGSALPYACIYINKSYYCVTNIDGIAFIPNNKLIFGDTIRATYIGLNPSMVIYTEKMQNTSESLMLNSEKVFEMSPVFVTSNFDHWRHFKKNLKPRNVLPPNCIINGNFEINILYDNNKSFKDIKGAFNLDNTLNKRAIYNYIFASLPTITSISPNVTLSEDTKRAMANALQISYQILSRIKAEHQANNKYSDITFLGIVDNYNCFRLVYTTKELQNKLSFQMEIYVDRETKEIKLMKYYSPSTINNRNFSSDQNSLSSASYKQLSSQRKKQRVESMVPDRIEFNFPDKNNQMIHLVLLNLDFSFL